MTCMVRAQLRIVWVPSTAQWLFDELIYIRVHQRLRWKVDTAVSNHERHKRTTEEMDPQRVHYEHTGPSSVR
jgi:formyltetrahydrofolate hydrolase